MKKKKKKKVLRMKNEVLQGCTSSYAATNPGIEGCWGPKSKLSKQVLGTWFAVRD
jgi:hypothetical protein